MAVVRNKTYWLIQTETAIAIQKNGELVAGLTTRSSALRSTLSITEDLLKARVYGDMVSTNDHTIVISNTAPRTVVIYERGTAKRVGFLGEAYASLMREMLAKDITKMEVYGRTLHVKTGEVLLHRLETEEKKRTMTSHATFQQVERYVRDAAAVHMYINHWKGFST